VNMIINLHVRISGDVAHHKAIFSSDQAVKTVK